MDQCRYRWHDILVTIGVDKNFLFNRHGECPVCGGKDRFRFDNKQGNGEYFCNGCGAGNGIILAMKFLGLPFKEAATEIRKIIGECRVTETTQVDDKETLKRNTERLKKIHSGLKKIRPDDIAGQYLLSRGIDNFPHNDCFFHPAIPYYFEGVFQEDLPAMVSVFRDQDNKTASYHVTFLAKNGEKFARKILPTILPLNGCAIQLFEPTDILCVAEGIESALSVNKDTGFPCWAAGNAGLMEKMIIPDVKHVFIYADSEPSFTGLKAAAILANRIAGKHESVTIVTMAEGKQVFNYGAKFDMNDYLMADTD